MNSSQAILMTGATGALGQELLREILQTSNASLHLIVRRKKQLSHWDRIRTILAPGNLERHLAVRVHVHEGDITEPFLGLNRHDWESLRSVITDFYHVAALTTLNGSAEDCERMNVQGTRYALDGAWDLRRYGKLKRFVYFSTAYASGSKWTHHAKEDSLPENPVFANEYEASKYRSEKSVRDAIQQGMPATIFRPSIIVGHSETGEVSEFNVIYPFIKLFAHGILSKIPTTPENAFNIVPIDFVVKASLAIANQPESLNHCYHLVTQNPPPIRLLFELKDKEYASVPDIEVISPENFSRESLSPNEQFVYDMMEPYLGYLNGNLTFDTTHTEAALKGTGIEFPSTDYNFIKKLLEYAADSGYLVIN